MAKFKIPSNILEAMATLASDKLNKRLCSELQSRQFNIRIELVDFVEELVHCQF